MFNGPLHHQQIFAQNQNTERREPTKDPDLEGRVDKLEMICEALWEIVKTETNWSDTDLLEKITQIDLRDGELDGKKRTVNVLRCTRCERMNSKRHNRCIYCGELFLHDPFG